MYRHLLLRTVVFGFVTMAAACARPAPAPTMNDIAERYVKLVLLVGQHDGDFVDAYYGDPSWKPTGTPVALDELAKRATAIRADLGSIPVEAGGDPLVALRHSYLDKQTAAVEARLAMLMGVKLSFDEEAARLYDATPPKNTEADFQPALDQLDRLLPGRGSLIDRFAEFRKRFFIPTDKLDAVFMAAIAECRKRTQAHLKLPPGEAFNVEYVKGKPWSAYNWYKGQFTSVIQVNTDFPITIDRAIDLACHEGYPGHHVYNTLLEKHLVKDRGWMEFSVYPLFSPQSLIAEGTANYGIPVTFSDDERIDFEQKVLFPAAGLDPARVREFYEVQALVEKLAYAGNEAARRYINKEIDAAQAAAWLERFALMSKERAQQRVRFFDQYRSYVINYNLGKDMVARYIEQKAGTDPAKRWQDFAALLSSPRLPSGLR